MSDDINEMIRQRDALNTEIARRIESVQAAHNRALWDIEGALKGFARERRLEVKERGRKNWAYITVGNRVEVGLGQDQSGEGRPYEPVTLQVLTPDGGIRYGVEFSAVPPQGPLLALIEAILKEEE